MNDKDMDSNTESFVSGGLAVLLRLTRIAGLAPLRFVKTGNGWRISLSSGWNIYGCIMITVINLVTSVSLITDMHLAQIGTLHMRNSIPRAVKIVQASAMVIASSAAVYTAPGVMHSMTACLNQVQKVNSELNIRHWPNYLGKNMICTAIVQAIVCVMLSVSNCLEAVISGIQMNEKAWSDMLYFVYFISFWIMQLRSLQFIVIVLHIKYSFKVVNNNLISILQDHDNFKSTSFSKEMINVIKKNERLNNYVNTLSVSGTTDSAIIDCKLTSDHRTVRRLSLAFSALCHVVRVVNQSHGPIVVILLANFFLHLFSTPYFFIIYMRDGTSGGVSALNATKLAVPFFWGLYHLYNLVTLVEPCHLTHMEMVKTRELVGQLMRHTRSIYDPLVIELEQFYRYLLLNEVSYDPLKFVKMTRNLTFTLLGSITTYTVLILNL